MASELIYQINQICLINKAFIYKYGMVWRKILKLTLIVNEVWSGVKDARAREPFGFTERKEKEKKGEKRRMVGYRES